MSKRDFYEILGVTKTASEQELKTAYRKLAMQHHPDRNPGDGVAEEKFKEAAEAYGVLSNAENRSRYDRFGHSGVGVGSNGAWTGGDFSGFEDIIGDLFGELFGGSRRMRRDGSQRGADLRYDLSMTLEESANGYKTKINIPRFENCDICSGSGAAPGSSINVCGLCGGAGQVRFQQGFFSVSRTCHQCRGTGRTITNYCKGCQGAGRVEKDHKIEIKIPAGVHSGARLRITGEGEAGIQGGPRGDLYVFIEVQEHELFERQGNNLYVNVPINFSQSALGAEIKVPTLDGEADLKVPEGTQTGSVFRVRGKGIVSLQGPERGDLFAVVTVQTPTRLNREQRKLLEQLGKLEEEKNQPRKLSDKVREIFG